MYLKLFAVIIFLFFLTSSLFAAENNSFTFYVMTDSHLIVNKDGGFEPFPSTVRIVNDIIKSEPDFVVHCGDMIHASSRYNTQEIADNMWVVFNSSVLNPLSCPILIPS